jgi:aminoglycoside phosphotransferase (APT) family kinase protein
VHKAREIARASDLPEAQHWNVAEKRLQRHLRRLATIWSRRPINAWCHGDLHPGNAMRRRGHRDGPCVLIDLALIHAGHWVEDAVYLERQFWGHPGGLFGIHPVSLLARYRRDLGLPTEGDYGALANVRRVLMAACAPVYLEHEGSPRYLHAALETLDKVLPQVAHL